MSGKGGIVHYIGLCALSASFGIADALVQGGMVGDMSFMCPEFIQVVLTQNIFYLYNLNIILVF
jgi:equilibrative nucleoside transporter 1/2/3